jgi:hypothetical protein
VLVVDDDPDALDLASAILTAAGAEVRTCGAATEALEIMGRWRPDVLVSDIEMPGEDGHALIRKVRALDAARGRKTPQDAGRGVDGIRTDTGPGTVAYRRLQHACPEASGLWRVDPDRRECRWPCSSSFLGTDLPDVAF